MQSGKSPENSASRKKKTISKKSAEKDTGVVTLASTSKKGASKEGITQKAKKAPREELPLKKSGATKPSTKTTKPFAGDTHTVKSKQSAGSPEKTSQWSPASFVPAAYAQRQSQIAPRYFFNDSIPQTYHESYFRAMARDPEWVFAYWEISPDQIKNAKSMIGDDAFGSAKRIIRILDVTGVQYDGSNALSYTDIEINDFANNWYLKVPNSGKTYLLEIGYLFSRGAFEVLMRSNSIAVPHAQAGPPAQGEEWGTVDTDELLRLSGLGRVQIGASESITLQQIERKAKFGNALTLEQIGASENVLFSGASENSSSEWAVNR